MRRRDFLALLGSAAATSLPARAQQAMPVIGYLGVLPPSALALHMTAFGQGLSETASIVSTLGPPASSRRSFGSKRGSRRPCRILQPKPIQCASRLCGPHLGINGALEKKVSRSVRPPRSPD